MSTISHRPRQAGQENHASAWSTSPADALSDADLDEVVGGKRGGRCEDWPPPPGLK